MPVEQQKFNAQQERVRKLAESYEGPEKKEVAELYVDRIAKLKSAIMDSQMNDPQKEDYIKRLDSYLNLVDANNLQRLKKEYEPLLRSMESTLKVEVKDQAEDDREAKLDDIVDLKIRQELLKEWKDATKLRQKFDSKKEQIELLIKTKNLDPAGTELQFYMTSMEVYTDFFDSKQKAYYETKDIGEKHARLKDILDQGDQFYDVLTEYEKLLRDVKSQDDLVVIDLNSRNALAEQMMMIKRKRYDENKKTLFKQMDDMHIPKTDPQRVQIEKMLEGADEQFDDFKENAVMAKTPEECTFQAEQAIKLLDGANNVIEASNKWLKLNDVKNTMGLRVPTLAKIVENKNCPTVVQKFLKASSFGMLLMPQFAVGFGYYQAAHQGEESGSNTALEVADFGISLIPIVGGLWDIGFAINGTTISGRKMGTTERIVRGVIGVGSIVLDIFTFGIGGTLAKAGGKAALKAGAEVTAHVAARAALEGGTKVVAEGGAKVVAEGVAKEGAEIGGHVIAEGAAKEGADVAGHAVAEGVGKEAVQKTAEQSVLSSGVQEAVNNSVKTLTKEQKALLVKVGTGAATGAERKAARELLKTVLTDAMKPFAEELGKKQAAKYAEQAAKIATRPASRVNRVLGALSFGGYKYGGMKGLEEGIAKGTAEQTLIKKALEGGKEVGMGYYVQGKFVKEGEILWGKMAGSVGKEAGKAWWHMHNPMEVLRMFQTPGKFLKGLFRRTVKGIPGNLTMNKAALTDLEQTAKASLLADGHDVKAVDALFADVKEKPWEQFVKENENNPMFKDQDVKEFFKDFSEQFPKSGLLDMKLSGKFPFVNIGKGEQGKVLSGFYEKFKGLENDAFTSAKMVYDSRRMEWPAFLKEYKDKGNLGKLTEAEIDALKSQFENLHSMDRELPVNLAKIKEGQQAAKKRVKLSKEEVKKLRGELNALEEEKSQVEDFMKKYSEGVASKGDKSLTQKETVEMLFEGYEKLPQGPLKKAVDEYRDELIKGLSKEVKADSEEFKQATAQAMRTAIPYRIANIEERLAAKIEEIGTAEVVLEVNKNVMKQGPNVPKKIIQKRSPEEFAEKSAQEAKDLMALEAKQKSIKKFEQEIKVLNSDRARFMDIDKLFHEALNAKIVNGKKLSPQEMQEVWYDVYTKIPAGPEKKAIDAIRNKNFPSMAKEGTDQWKQEMGKITQEHIDKRWGEVLGEYEEARGNLHQLDEDNSALKDPIGNFNPYAKSEKSATSNVAAEVPRPTAEPAIKNVPSGGEDMRRLLAEQIKKGELNEAGHTLIESKFAEKMDKNVYNLKNNGDGTHTVIGVLDPDTKVWVGAPPKNKAA